MYGAENTISVSTVLRYAPLRMINAGFQSSPGSTICGDANERRKEVKGEGTDPEHKGKVQAKLVLAATKCRIKGTLRIIQFQIFAARFSKILIHSFIKYANSLEDGRSFFSRG